MSTLATDRSGTIRNRAEEANQSMAANRELKARVKALLVRQLKLKMKPDEIQDEAPLFGDGLGLDSIDVLEVVASVEREFGVAIRSQEEGERVLQSVTTLADYLAEKGVSAGDGS
jgi:acyl carrier protein